MSELEDWRKVRLVVVDVEGNGRQPPDIVEIAVVSLENGQVAGTPTEWLVRPGETIIPAVIRLHGITNEMVSGAPCFSDVSDAVRAALRDDYLVAHNAGIELGVLTPRLPGWKPRGVVDTLRLARELLPGRKSHALKSLTQDLELADPIVPEAKGPHRAAYDALMTARLFMHLAVTPSGAPRPIPMLMADAFLATPSAAPQGNLF